MDNLPSDLSDVLKILHEWQPMHTEGHHLVSIPGNIPLLNMRLSLPHDINAFPFSKYASRYIRDHRLGITQEPLRLPFLPKHSSQDNRDALDLFTLILSYMFERRLNEDRRLILADYIIQKGLSRESLRDEIYIQLINQTFENGPGSGPDTAWLLLANCLSTFAPSTVLAKHLLKYVSDAGVDGFDAVCQQKLLQCFGLEPELSRSYPPCLLEWTTNKKKAAMAVYAGFADGEQGVCQVESWTTGEQLAVNMFRSRHITDNLKGWSVQLRDDVDTYECAGYDYVLDLISEMELPPSFPCATAYFLTMTDISRPASTNRRHWPDEPHNAEKLRLMPLEVDELSDQPVAVLPAPVPISRSPPPPSPAPPPKRISFVEEPPEQPEPPRANPKNSYRKSDDAMAQGSALNKRKDRVPDELSKTSVLNSRYAQGHTAADTSKAPEKGRHREHREPQHPAKQKPVSPPVADDPPVVKRKTRAASQQQQQQQQQAPQKPAGGEEDMSAWLDSVFREALSGGAGGAGGAGQGLGNPQAVSRHMKGGGDDLQTQFGLVGGVGVGGAYGLNAFGIQASTGAAPVMGPSVPPSVYPSQLMQAQSAGLSQMPQGMPTVITQAAMPPALPVVVDPAIQLMHQQQFIQQQQQQQQQQLQQQQQQQQQLLQHLRLQHQQQIQMHQHAAELQVQLQTKELEKQVLQSTIHAEMLKQQLQHLQDSQQPQPQQQKAPQHPPAPQQHQQQTSHQNQQQQQQMPQQLHQQHQQHQQQQQRPQSTSSAAVAMRHSFAAADDHPRPNRPVSGSYIHPATPEPSLNRQRVPGEVDETRPGGVQTLKRSYLTKASTEPRPLPLPGGLPAVSKQVAAVAVAHNKARQPVKFADQVDEGSSDEEDVPAAPRPPSPPIVKKETKAAVPAQKKTVAKQTKSQPAAQIIKPAAAVIVTKTVVTKPVVNSAPATNGEVVVEEILRKSPGKIGIKWPPEPEKVEKQTIPVNRLLITETKEEKMAIQRGLSSEEVQQKINNRIKSSQQAAERDDPPPLPPPARRPPPPLAVTTRNSEVQMDAGTQVQTWNKIDMATKKKELETMLRGVQWGTQNKKEAPVVQPPAQPSPPAVHESQSAHDPSRLDNIRTVLHAQCTGPFYAYKNVPWSLEIRKEVFSPSENLNNPILVDLVFAQIVSDVLSGDSIRITADDKRKMRKLLDTHGINLRNNGTGQSTQVKKAVIKAAKELPIFFARIFPVNGGSKQSRVQMVAASHSGVRLLARHKDVFDDYIIIFEHIKFSDVIDVHVPKSSTLLMRLTGRNIVLYTKYATHLCEMLNSYRQEHSEIIPKIRINDNDDDDDD